MSNHTRLNVARFQVLLPGNTSSLSSSNLDHLVRDHHIGQLTAKKFFISSNRPRALWLSLPSHFCRTDGKCKAVLALTTLQPSTEVVVCAKRERDPRALSSRKPARSYSQVSGQRCTRGLRTGELQLKSQLPCHHPPLSDRTDPSQVKL